MEKVTDIREEVLMKTIEKEWQIICGWSKVRVGGGNEKVRKDGKVIRLSEWKGKKWEKEREREEIQWVSAIDDDVEERGG